MMRKQKKKLENELFKPAVVQTKVPLGVDPKSYVCEFYKKGLCTKGDKCKFSHNVDQGRKSSKIDLYTDRRDITDDERATLEADTMETWDQNKLETVVEKKQGDTNRQMKTKIVCKYFLEAIENRKYGWFWECPNGGDKCMYQHSLPPGFELKSSKKEEEDEEPISVEEQIEEERAKLTKRTPLTLELFLKWKEEKKKQFEDAQKEQSIKREADIRSGKVMRSGREMFVFNPSLFVDDDDVLDTTELPVEKEDEVQVIRIEVSGTSITRRTENGEEEEQEDGEEGVQEESSGEEGMERGSKEEESDGENENQKEEPPIMIEESLFVEEDIPDDIDEDVGELIE